MAVLISLTFVEVVQYKTDYVYIIAAIIYIYIYIITIFPLSTVYNRWMYIPNHSIQFLYCSLQVFDLLVVHGNLLEREDDGRTGME